MYKTKSQKKNALIAIDQRAKKLFLTGVLDNSKYQTIARIVSNAMKKL